MLHDTGDDQRASDALKDLLDRMTTDDGIRSYLEEYGTLESRRSRMHYFLSCNAKKQGDEAKSKEHLQEAIRHDPGDADVLIALYRLPNQTPAELQDTKNLIEQTTQKFAEDVLEASGPLDSANPRGLDSLDPLQQKYIGQACNQYAWLVANTFGDQDEALRCGLLSVEVNPNESGRIDTLARCYYAKGDIDAAIRTQKSALKIDPHSGALARQLKFFESEKEAKAKPSKS